MAKKYGQTLRPGVETLLFLSCFSFPLPVNIISVQKRGILVPSKYNEKWLTFKEDNLLYPVHLQYLWNRISDRKLTFLRKHMNMQLWLSIQAWMHHKNLYNNRENKRFWCSWVTNTVISNMKKGSFLCLSYRADSETWRINLSWNIIEPLFSGGPLTGHPFLSGQ